MAPGEEVANATREYFTIRMLSSPFVMANYAIFGWFLGQGFAKTALLLQILMNGINIALSILLGLSMAWGIEGVAIASLIAETTGFLLGLFLAMRLLPSRHRPQKHQILSLPAIKRLMSLNGDILIRSFALLFAFAYFTAQSTKFGNTVLAANAILFHFFYISGYFLDGLAIAAEQICGRAVGAADRKAFVRAVKLTMGWSITLAILLALVFLLTGEAAISFIAKSQSVQLEAMHFFVWAAMISLVGVTAFVMDGIYIGATWSREMSITMVVSLAGFILIWQLIGGALGNDGLWLAFYCFLLLRGATMSTRLPRNIRLTFRDE